MNYLGEGATKISDNWFGNFIPTPSFYMSTNHQFYRPFARTITPKITMRNVLWALRVLDVRKRLPTVDVGNRDHIGEIKDGWILLRPDDLHVPNPLELYNTSSCAVYVGVGREDLLPMRIGGDLREIAEIPGGTYLLVNYQKMKTEYCYLQQELQKERNLREDMEVELSYYNMVKERKGDEPETWLNLREASDWINTNQSKRFVPFPESNEPR